MHGTGRVTEASVIPFWEPRLQHSDPAARLFHTIRRSDRAYLTQEDFQPFTDELMMVRDPPRDTPPHSAACIRPSPSASLTAWRMLVR